MRERGIKGHAARCPRGALCIQGHKDSEKPIFVVRGYATSAPADFIKGLSGAAGPSTQLRHVFMWPYNTPDGVLVVRIYQKFWVSGDSTLSTMQPGSTSAAPQAPQAVNVPNSNLGKRPRPNPAIYSTVNVRPATFRVRAAAPARPSTCKLKKLEEKIERKIQNMEKKIEENEKKIEETRAEVRAGMGKLQDNTLQMGESLKELNDKFA